VKSVGLGRLTFGAFDVDVMETDLPAFFRRLE
jgi:hypothetical protein